MASVQFIGRAALLKGMKDKLDTWGLFQSKQFLVAGDGSEELDEFLQKLEPGGSVAVYTLKLYTAAKAEDIDEKTPSQGSINFKLTDPATGTGSLAERLDRIEGMLAGDFDGDEEPDENEESLAGIILGYLKDPQKIATIIGAFNDLKRGSVPAAMIPGAVGAFDDKPKGDAPPDWQNQVERLSKVLDRLQQADPGILEHLEKLADLAERKPDFFKMLLKQLDSGF
jgi:hypothetical protein